MRRAILILCFVLFGATGCVHSPGPADLASADYGPKPENYEETIKNVFTSKLRDPSSAQWNFGAPYQGYAIASPIQGGYVQGYGWFLDVGLNAKNGFGGYTGFQNYRLFYSHGSWHGPCLQHMGGFSCSGVSDS